MASSHFQVKDRLKGIYAGPLRVVPVPRDLVVNWAITLVAELPRRYTTIVLLTDWTRINKLKASLQNCPKPPNAQVSRLTSNNDIMRMDFKNGSRILLVSTEGQTRGLNAPTTIVLDVTDEH